MGWEYRTSELKLSEKWSPKRQTDELDRFTASLNEFGADGWELVTYQSVPMTGSIVADKIKGYAYLAIFKRPVI